MGQVQAKEAQGPGPASDEIPLANIRAKVVNVSVDGIVRTKNDVIMDTVSDLFKVKVVIPPWLEVFIMMSSMFRWKILKIWF